MAASFVKFVAALLAGIVLAIAPAASRNSHAVHSKPTEEPQKLTGILPHPAGAHATGISTIANGGTIADVTGVNTSSRAAQPVLRTADVVFEINHAKVMSPERCARLWKESKGRTPLRVSGPIDDLHCGEAITWPVGCSAARSDLDECRARA